MGLQGSDLVQDLRVSLISYTQVGIDSHGMVMTTRQVVIVKMCTCEKRQSEAQSGHDSGASVVVLKEAQRFTQLELLLIGNLIVCPPISHLPRGMVVSVCSSRNLPRAPPSRVLTGHRGPVTCVATHPVFAIVASGSEDATIKVHKYTSDAMCTVTGVVHRHCVYGGMICTM